MTPDPMTRPDALRLTRARLYASTRAMLDAYASTLDDADALRLTRYALALTLDASHADDRRASTRTDALRAILTRVVDALDVDADDADAHADALDDALRGVDDDAAPRDALDACRGYALDALDPYALARLTRYALDQLTPDDVEPAPDPTPAPFVVVAAGYYDADADALRLTPTPDALDVYADRARYFGYDAGLSAGTGVIVSDDDARAMLDADHADALDALRARLDDDARAAMRADDRYALDLVDVPTLADVVEARWSTPNLSGEYADDPTPSSLRHDVDPTGALDDDAWQLVESEVCDAYDDAAWRGMVDALTGQAYRSTGQLVDALRVERAYDAHADALRALARLDDAGDA